jgi:TonB-dependent starch-binding outer membrane protein SusC
MKNESLHTLTGLGRSPDFLRLLLFAFLVLLITPAVQGQTLIRGKVTDENGTGMPGVNILVKGTTTGTTTDSDGAYSLNAEASDAVLVFSFIGYTSEELPVNGRSSIDVSLTPSIESLNEIVVIGYGTQKKSDVTGALVSVNSQALREVPVANLQQALQGRAAGVEVIRVGTAPGGTARIRIRGERTLNGTNEPLIVLDGIPFEGGLNDINQDEIASIDILKDASATAIYGSRGANGVVLITTKRGKAGETRLNFDSYYGVTTVARKYDMYNAEEYAAMRDASSYPNGYLAPEVEGMAIGRNTDWQDLMYEDGYITNHNLNISGGTEASQFSLGGGYYKETTILPGQDFERFSLRVTIDTKVGERLKIGINSLNSLNFNNGSQFVNQQPDTPGAYGGSVMYNILSTSPLMPAYTPAGEIYKYPAGNTDDANNQNPLFLKNNRNDWVDKVRRMRSFNSLYAEYQIIDGLKYRFNLGLDFTQNNSGQFRGADSYFRSAASNQGRVRNAEQLSWVAENLVTYEKTLAEKHRLTFTGLFSAQKLTSWNTQVSNDSITADAVEFYNLGLSNHNRYMAAEGGEATWGLISFMARINYAFNDRYLLTATLRRDGSSRLATGNKWLDYPAIAAGWNIMNESFMQGVGTISNLKLRVGYGRTANQSIPPYTTLGGVNNSYQGVPIRYNYGSNRVLGFLPTVIPDKDLHWEPTDNLNVGLDFGILADRITGSVEWYKSTTTDVLFPLQMPITSGYPNAFQTNLGKMENKGFEVAVSATILKLANGFSWNTDVNWYYNRNKLLEIDGVRDRDIGNGLYVGEPLNAIYDFKKLGIWQEDEADVALTFGQLPGQLKLADISGPEGIPDGLITTDYDRTIIGNQQAKWQAGMTNRFSYKGFDLSVVAFMRYGGLLQSYLHAPNGSYLTNLNGLRNGVDVEYWTPENRSNWFPAPSAAFPTGAPGSWTTLAYYDASFIKIRSINFGYALPKSLTQRIKAQSVRVYFTAQNPFLLWSPYVSKWNGVDPEPTGQGNTGAVATSGTYRTGGPNPGLLITTGTPPTRAFIFGVNFGF